MKKPQEIQEVACKNCNKVFKTPVHMRGLYGGIKNKRQYCSVDCRILGARKLRNMFKPITQKKYASNLG